MDLFNKTFFRFAFGFVAIIMLSLIVIVAVNTLEDHKGGGQPCGTLC